HRVDAWVIDRQAHGSIKAALALSDKPKFTSDFRLLDGDLRERHHLSAGATLAVVAEPVDPMSGDLFDLSRLARSLSNHDYLVLDEARSLGGLGKSGKGALEHLGLQRLGSRLVRTGTFSKAIGSHGGYVLGASDVIADIKHLSGCYKSSTPLNPPACA